MNLYGMVGNDPTNRVDALGLLDGGASNTMLHGKTEGPSIPDIIRSILAERDRCACEKLQKLLEMALLARAGYSDWGGGLPPGWTLGDSVDDPRSGFNASIFLNADRNQVAVVFRGTENSPISHLLNDWSTNITEPFGISRGFSQLDQAANLAAGVRSDYSGSNITLIGHSEAGAEAAIGSMRTGLPAVTFNPLGVSYPAAIRAGINPFLSPFGPGNITGVYTRGEILTTLESYSGGLIPLYDGNLLGLDPAGRSPNYLDLGYRVQLHQMNQVIDAIEGKMNELGCKQLSK